MPLTARKITAILLQATEKEPADPEFFAVGNCLTTVLFRAVKGGGNMPRTKISAVFKVHSELFLFDSIFIIHLTLPLTFSTYLGLIQKAF